jgi:hypothetical protein
MGEWMYRPTFSCSQHYLEMSGQVHTPAALPAEKEPPILIVEEPEWAPVPVWTIWRYESSCPHRDSKSDPLVIQPVANRYTD